MPKGVSFDTFDCMRVVLLMNSLFTGGAEFSSLQFYGWLKGKGHQVKIVVLKVASPAYDPKRFGLDDVVVLPGNSFIRNLKALRQSLSDFKPALVHSVLFDANVLGRLARMRYGGFIHMESLVNEMYSEHRYVDPQVTPLKLSWYRLLDWITQWKGVDHYHANGQAVAWHYQQKLGIRSDRMTVIPRGRERNSFAGDSENRKNIRAMFGTGDRLLLINMARHEYQKGQDILLEALGSLKDQIQGVQLVIVGREGKLTPLLKDKIRKNEWEDSVVLAGHQDDVSKLLAAADVFVFPSRFEGLPGALIEAEAAGLPIICSDIPNNREVANQSNAYFFQMEQVEELASVLSNMIADRESRQAMAVESLKIFNEQFQLENIHTQMENLIMQCVSGNK
jgi:glycosyltransferase involved in cell wall biosynthesis